jgi:hypothetical protein
MERYDFFYGSQLSEFESPKVPEIIAREGLKANVAGSKYILKVKPSKTKAVIKDVYYQAE